MDEPLEYASIGRRALAALVDVPLALMTSGCLAHLALQPLGAAAAALNDLPAREIAWQVSECLVGLGSLTLYFALGESSGWRATPGKMLLGIEVVDLAARGESPGHGPRDA